MRVGAMWRGWQVCALRRTPLTTSTILANSRSYNNSAHYGTLQPLHHSPTSTIYLRSITTTRCNAQSQHHRRRYCKTCAVNALAMSLRSVSVALCKGEETPSLTMSETCDMYMTDEAVSSNATHDYKEEDDENEEMDVLDAYEAMLLNAQAEPTDTSNINESNTNSDINNSEGDKQTNNSMSRVEQWAHEVTALLPADATPVRLTEITPLIDAEGMCEAYGSVLAFLQRLPSRFICTCQLDEAASLRSAALSPATPTTRSVKRWYVARVPSTTTAMTHDSSVESYNNTNTSASDVKAVLSARSMQDWYLQEAWKEVRHGANEPQYAPDVRQPQSSAMTLKDKGEDKPVERSKAESAHDTTQLQEDTLTAGTATKKMAETHVSRRLVRVCDVSSSASRENVSLPLSHDDGYNSEVWNVELELDEPTDLPNDDDIDDTNNNVHEGTNAIGAQKTSAMRERRNATSAEEVVVANASQQPVRYDGLDDDRITSTNKSRTKHSKEGLHRATSSARAQFIAELDWAALAQAPVVISDESARTAPTVKPRAEASTYSVSTAIHKQQQQKKMSLTPEELLAEHERIARAKGWRSPQEMLELFVECVPTFYVPLKALRQTDLLAKTLGPRNRMAAVVRIYSYFFDYDATKATVRLKPTLQHAQLGSANVYYTPYAPNATDTVEYDAKEGTSTKSPVNAGETRATKDNAAQKERTRLSVNKSPSLQPSATTRSFPVLQPLLVSKVKLAALHQREKKDGTRTLRTEDMTSEASKTEVRNSFANNVVSSHSMQLAANKAEHPVVHPSSYSSDGGKQVKKSCNPFADEDPAKWPILAQLACALPFHCYVPLRQAAALANISLDALQHAIDPTNQEHALYAPFLTTSERYDTTKNNNSNANDEAAQGSSKIRVYQVRLRPYWLAPQSLGERTGQDLPQPLLRQLRPAWVPLEKVWHRLDEATRETLRRDAQRSQFADDKTIYRSNRSREQEEMAMKTTGNELEYISTYLRYFGAVCWVSEGGDKLRRYTADAELDDITHILVLLLHRCATDQFMSLTDLIAKAHHCCAQCMASHGATYNASYGIAGQLPADAQQLQAIEHILRTHHKLFELNGDSTQNALHVKRRSVYGQQGTAATT